MQPAVTDLSVPRGHFLMWRDYLELGNTLLDQREEATESGARTGPLSIQTPAPIAPIITPLSTVLQTGTQSSLTVQPHGPPPTVEHGERALAAPERTEAPPKEREGCCAFCRQNGESAAFYRSHRLRWRDGRVRCPVLRSYVCPLCRATGDTAHTLRYCPQSSVSKPYNSPGDTTDMRPDCPQTSATHLGNTAGDTAPSLPYWSQSSSPDLWNSTGDTALSFYCQQNSAPAPWVSGGDTALSFGYCPLRSAGDPNRQRPDRPLNFSGP
ncbi:uncharacterized protein nanos2 [Hoplias malabaricus]|uniref:uncharacterized protein nanos2 n=1 Tax=Hoplias malabaricus TaxID=27720 RepID=UPI0034634BFE